MEKHVLIINKKIKILTQERFFSCYVANQFVFSPSYLTKFTSAKNACFRLDFLHTVYGILRPLRLFSGSWLCAEEKRLGKR